MVGEVFPASGFAGLSKRFRVGIIRLSIFKKRRCAMFRDEIETLNGLRAKLDELRGYL